MKTRGLVFEAINQLGGAEPSTATLHDWSRYKHDFAMTNITWEQTVTGVWYAVFNGTSSRATATGAATPDMNFVTENYTILCWFNWQTGETSQHIIGRYVLDNNGWEIYLTEYGGDFSLTNRHHHSGTIVDTHPRTAYNSVGWTQDTIWFMAITRSGTAAIHYRNGVSVATTFSTGGLVDPESCVQAPVIGIRYTLNANWLNGSIAGLRVFNYAMTPAQIRAIYHAEKYLIGVAS